MEEADMEKLEGKIKEKVKKADREYVGFEWFFETHLKKVQDKALKLSDNYEPDKVLLKLGSVAHDIGYLEPSKNHEKVGYDVLLKFVDENGVEISSNEEKRLREIIEEHGYNGNPVFIEAKIVAAADALCHFKPEFVAAKSRVDKEKGVPRDEFEEWLREKWRKDLKKAKVLEESAEQAEKLEQVHGEFIHGAK